MEFAVLTDVEHPSTAAKALTTAIRRLHRGDWERLLVLARDAVPMVRVDRLHVLATYAWTCQLWQSRRLSESRLRMA